MSWTQDLADLAARKERIAGKTGGATASQGPGRAARDRLGTLLDEGSFVEIGQLATSVGMESEAVVTGSGTIEGRPVFVFSQDYEVRSGSMSRMHASKIERIYELALKTGAPIIGVYDSTGARLEEGGTALTAYGTLLAKQSEISGVVPQIALVLGPCAGTAAFAPALCDIVIVGGEGAVFLAGPQVVAARTGDAKPGDIGGGEALRKDGFAHLSYKDEKDALNAARALIALLPSNNLEDAPVTLADDLNRLVDGLEEGPMEMAALLPRLVDHGVLLTLQPGYSKAITALGRLGGYAAGIVAATGELDEATCDQIARFVRLCDSFNLPIVTLCDAQGFEVSRHHAALVRAAARLLYAYAEATVPKVTVVTGDAIGGSYLALGCRSMGADMTYAWPSAVIAAMDPMAAAQIVYEDDLKRAENPIAARDAYASRYIDEHASAMQAEAQGLIDAVIAPADTRRMLIAGLYMLESKRDARAYPKKHGNAPL